MVMQDVVLGRGVGPGNLVAEAPRGDRLQHHPTLLDNQGLDALLRQAHVRRQRGGQVGWVVLRTREIAVLADDQCDEVMVRTSRTGRAARRSEGEVLGPQAGVVAAFLAWLLGRKLHSLVERQAAGPWRSWRERPAALADHGATRILGGE